MNSVSIGYLREDGDFAILATLNNNDGYLLSNEFSALIKYFISFLKKSNPLPSS